MGTRIRGVMQGAGVAGNAHTRPDTRTAQQRLGLRVEAHDVGFDLRGHAAVAGLVLHFPLYFLSAHQGTRCLLRHLEHQAQRRQPRVNWNHQGYGERERERGGAGVVTFTPWRTGGIGEIIQGQN
jgi:hypothetical protein